MPDRIFITRLSVSSVFLLLQSCRLGIQEYINELHRKQAVREERLGKQPCLLLASPICPLHLGQHGKRLRPNCPTVCRSTLHQLNIESNIVQYLCCVHKAEEITLSDMGNATWAFFTSISPPETSICLKSHLNPAKAFSSQCSHSSLSALLRARQELTGWKWIPLF